MRLSPFSIIITFAALMLVGAAFIPRLSLQLHPSATLPKLRVYYYWHEASAINIEREVTSKLEGAISSIADVEDVSSVSTYGYGYIDVSFKKNVDTDIVRFEIASMIRRLYPEFPDEVTYPVISVSRAAGRHNPLLTYTIFAPYPSHMIEKYAQGQIIPPVSNINGVDHISFYGANPVEYSVVYDSRKLQNLNIPVDSLSRAIENHFSERFMGRGLATASDEKKAGKISVVLKTEKSGESMWDNIPVANVNGRTIFLNDVASVDQREQLPRSYYRINGQETINFVVYATEGSNHIRVANEVKETMQGIMQNMPQGYNILLAYDDTEYIKNDLRRIGVRMLLALVILLSFVLLISRKIKYLLLIVVTLAANILLAIVLYYFAGIEIHLYSLAGITVSFGIIIDNTIVMIDHLRHQKNKKVFIAILAATLTTIGALSVIFFLSYVQRVQLKDFALVMLVNLFVSLIVAWFFVPALLSRMSLTTKVEKAFIRRKRRVVKVSRFYTRSIIFTKRFRWVFFVLVILAFGIPVHWLPREVEGDSHATAIYNKTIGSSWYQTNMRNVTEKVLGGSLRLFSHYVFQHSYFTDPERTTLVVRAQMPDGCTVHQLNQTVMLMENFISGFEQVEQFQTRVLAYNNGLITIYIKPEYDHSFYPHYLQQQLIQKALSLGGAEWRIHGVGRGFSNVLGGGSGNASIVLDGYNYNQLYSYAEILLAKASENPRVSNERISGGDMFWRTTDRMEYYMDFDDRYMALHNIFIDDFYYGLREKIAQSNISPVFDGTANVPVRLVSDRHENYTAWHLENEPVNIGGVPYSTSNMITLDKRLIGNDIYKYNQQYRLTVHFDFLGPHVPMQRLRDRLIDEMNEVMPLGYTAGLRKWEWSPQEKEQYYLILLVIVIIYFVCAILLESLLQPLAVIGMIPISFIGLFLTFYLFNLNFDQGGLAAFILLSGLVVNAGLYILNDFNNFRKRRNQRGLLRTYVKAFNNKIIPAMLTISSTVLGLIPFVAGKKEAFWFAFAAGAMGGLVFSLIAIFLFFPLFLKLETGRGGR